MYFIVLVLCYIKIKYIGVPCHHVLVSPHIVTVALSGPQTEQIQNLQMTAKAR